MLHTNYQTPQYTNEFTKLITETDEKFSFNIILISIVSLVGICVLIILTCIIYRCIHRDEGAYNIEESLAYNTDEHPNPNSKFNQSPMQILDLQPSSIASLELVNPNEINIELPQILSSLNYNLTPMNNTQIIQTTKLDLVSSSSCQNTNLPINISSSFTNSLVSTHSSNSNIFLLNKKSNLKKHQKSFKSNPKEWYV